MFRIPRMELYAGRLMWWTAGTDEAVEDDWVAGSGGDDDDEAREGDWVWKYSGKPVADFVWYQGKKPWDTTENYLCLDSFNNYNQSVIVGSVCSDTKSAFTICQRHKNRN